jgi:hypothetical protein
VLEECIELTVDPVKLGSALGLAPTGRDERLVAQMAQSHAARRLILDSRDRSIAAIAANANRCRTRLGKLAALACLAPDIVRAIFSAIVEGRQPAALAARTLPDIDPPLGWTNQRVLLGFG